MSLGRLALIAVLVVFVMGVFASIGDRPSPDLATVGADQGTWKVKNFQDAGIDISNRSPKIQQGRWEMSEVFFTSITPPRDKLVKAEVHRLVRDRWYADDVLRQNAAGMLYAYYFSDDSGMVAVYDNGKQVGAYRWENGPHYSNVQR
jgi:hypothetical protein